MQRDLSIDLIKARPNRRVYGMGLGIMILDEVYPGFPGDIRNASGYPFPIQYQVMEDLNCNNIAVTKNNEDDAIILASIMKAAKRLEWYGCKAIVAECGYFSYFQQMVAGEIDIPVFMSSLLQVPMIQQVIGPKKAVGIFCGQASSLSDAHLTNVGIDLNSNFHVKGAIDESDCSQFMALWREDYRKDIPEASYKLAEKEILISCKDFVKKHPDIGAIMLECTGFQSFAKSIQRELDLPVYSWSTLLDYAYSVVVHRDFYGHV